MFFTGLELLHHSLPPRSVDDIHLNYENIHT